MNILILGTGALATMFAARLSQAGQQITLLGTWRAALDSLNREGARWMDEDGTEHASRVHATDDVRECRGAQHALVLVKAWQTERAARQLAECLAADGLALTLQNGLGNHEILSRELGDERAARGVTTVGATLLEPGRARAGGAGITSMERDPALGPLAEALEAASFKVQVVEDARSLVWGKLVVSAAINPLTALLRVQNGELLRRPAARELMGVLAQESAQVAQAEEVDLPYPDAAAAAEDVARQTAGNTSSMLQDVLRGAPTEIDAICGAVATLGEKHGFPAPANRTCWRLVRSLQEDPE